MNIKEKVFNKKSVDIIVPFVIYFICLSLTLSVLFEARENGLLGMPVSGMDQHTMLQTAINLYYRRLPEGYYYYSYTYTIFLYFLILISNGNLILMKIFQAAVCALIPVVIYKLSLRINTTPFFAFLSSLLYCLYAPAILISLSFLRAAPLALCFISFVYAIVLAYQGKKTIHYIIAGLFAALCILGRENFIPVIFVPFIFLFFRKIRENIEIISLMIGTSIALSIIFTFITFNYFMYNCFAIIPGHVSNILGAYHGDAYTSGYTMKLIFDILYNIPDQFRKFFSSYEIPNSLSVYAHQDIIRTLNYLFIPFNLLIALTVVSLLGFKDNKYLIFILVLSILYICSMIFFNMFYRFRIPVVPLLCVLSGISLEDVFLNWHKKRINSLIIILFSVLIFYLSYISPDKLRTEGEKLSVIKILIQRKRYDDAKDKLKNMNEKSDNVKYMWIKYYQHKNGKQF